MKVLKQYKIEQMKNPDFRKEYEALEVKSKYINYKKLGQFIRQVDVRNTNLSVDRLLGVSVQKKFIPSIANTVGTDFSKYKIVERGQFTYIPDTSRRGDKIGIALLDNYDEGLVSNIYTVFEIIDKTKLIPEYLMLWFSRPEFDRYARYKSHGSVREIFDWNEMCNVELPVPPIEKQFEIVHQYKVISDRIALKQKINNTLEEILKLLFKKNFIGNEDCNTKLMNLENVIDVRDGTHDSPKPVSDGKYLITSRHLLPYGVNRKDAYYISESDFQEINKRSKVEYGDILFSMIGTVGNISLITDNEVDFAIKNVALFKTSKNDFLRYFILLYLKSDIVKEYISSSILGSTQNYVSLSILRKLQIILPSNEVISKFNNETKYIFNLLILNSKEIKSLQILNDILIADL